MNEQSDADTPSPDNLGDDLVWGAKGIAKTINKSERATYHLMRSGKIPVGKVGSQHVGSKSRLRKHFAAITGGGEAA